MRRFLVPLLASAALLGVAAPASAAGSWQDPINTFAVENFADCARTSSGTGIVTCAQRLQGDVVFHAYTCYMAAKRVLDDGSVKEYRACLNAETRRKAIKKKSSRKR